MFSIQKTWMALQNRRQLSSRIGLVVALVFSSPVTHAQLTGLTIQQAIHLATRQSASNKAGLESVEASRQAAAKADQQPDPMLKLGIDNLPVSGEDRFSLTRDFMTMRRVGIEQEWVSSDKRIARSERARRAVDMEEASYLSNVAKVCQETAKAWVNVWYGQHVITLAKAMEKEAAGDLQAAQVAHRGAKATASEVSMAQLVLAQAKDASRKADQELRAARTALSRWTTLPVENVTDAIPPLVSHTPQLSIEDLERYHPMVLMARRSVAMADAETTVAARERNPNVSVEASFSQRGSQYGNMVSFGINIPLPINPSQRQNRDVAEKSAMATKARFQYQEALRELQADIQSASTTLESQKERLSMLKKELLPAANQQVELALAAYRGGSGTLSGVYNARKMLLEKQLMIADLEKEAALVWASLEYHVIPHEITDRGRSE
jgi:outer membrane protein TolC